MTPPAVGNSMGSGSENQLDARPRSRAGTTTVTSTEANATDATCTSWVGPAARYTALLPRTWSWSITVCGTSSVVTAPVSGSRTARCSRPPSL